MKPRPTALIIDDDRANRRLVRIALEQERYKVIEAGDHREGLRAATAHRLDVLILELDLPGKDGLSVLRHLRQWSRVPVMVLSERSSTEDKVAAFDNGADDYMTKPFEPAELLARLRVMQRSIPGTPDGPLLIEGDLEVNLATHEITFRGEKLSLTPTEESLFYLLVKYAGKVVTCQHLLRSVWGSENDEHLHDLRVYIAHLRKKLGDDSEIIIRCENSIGYCLAINHDQNDSRLAAMS